MTLNDEIEAVKAATRKRIAAIRAREAKVQQRLDLRVVALLRERHPDAAVKLEAAARDEIAAEVGERSAVAAAAAAKRAEASKSVPAPSGREYSDADRDDHDHGSGS